MKQISNEREATSKTMANNAHRREKRAYRSGITYKRENNSKVDAQQGACSQPLAAK